VQANIKKKYVRNVIRFWVQIARANILHDIKKKAKKAEEDSEEASFNNGNFYLSDISLYTLYILII
jgi:hypothetical protein